MELTEKAAYLQGLIEGLGLDDSTKEGKVILAMSELMAEMADAMKEMDDDVSKLYGGVDILAEELEALEKDLYEDEDEDEEDDEDDDDDYEYEITCTKCGAVNLASEEAMFAEEELFCASCHEKLDFYEDAAEEAPEA